MAQPQGVKAPHICSICGNAIEIQISGWEYGHNAQPVNDGRCCTLCNDLVVIPTRLRRFYNVTK